MKKTEILRDLFDEKIISILNLFLENPGKKFSLSQVSSLSRINIATTLRIVDKLIKKDIVEMVLIGKTKVYRLNRNEKTIELNRLLRSEDGPLWDFVDKLSKHPRVKKIILESKTKDSCKLVIVGDYLPKEKINSLVEEIRRNNHFRIQFIEITEKQFNDMENIGIYDMNKKVIWMRRK